MKRLRDLIKEVRLPTAKSERDFYKAHVDNIEVVDDPYNKDNKDNPLKKLPKTYTGKDPKGGRVAEAYSFEDKMRGKREKKHPKEPVEAETPIKEDVELLSEDEMARRAYVYERIFTLIDDISNIIDEFYTEEKDYENAINARGKEYKKNPDKDPKIPYPEYPTRPWSIVSVASQLDEIYQTLLGNTNRDIDHVYEEVALVEMKKPELFKKANETIEAQLSLKTKIDKNGVQDATGSDTSDYSEETEITEDDDHSIHKFNYKTNAWDHAATVKGVSNARKKARELLNGNHGNQVRITDKNGKKIRLKEETEITEISAELVSRYRGTAKGDRDYHTANKAHADFNHDKVDTGPGAKEHYKKVAAASAAKIKKRTAGIAAATKRIGEETEVEELDEISVKKLQQYKDAGGKTEKGHILATNKIRAANKAKDFLHPEKGASDVSPKHAPKVAASNPIKPPKKKHSPTRIWDHVEYSPEVEQIDELSKNTLKSYVKKASAEVRNTESEAGKLHREASKHEEKARKAKSSAVATKATHRDLPDSHVTTKHDTDFAKRVSNVTNKKKLLARSETAHTKAKEHGDKASELRKKGDDLLNSHKHIKRHNGVMDARDKILAKEETELAELSQETKTNYFMKATADRATANQENKDAINKAKKVGKRDPMSGRALLKIARDAAARRDRREKGLSKL